MLQFRLAQIMTTLRMRQYDVAVSQIESLGDLNDLSKKTGQPIPFALTIIKALMPHFLNNTDQTIDNLYILLHECNTKLAQLDPEEKGFFSKPKRNKKSQQQQEDKKPLKKDEQQIALWKSRALRVIWYIVNCHLVKKEYELALELMECVAQKTPDDITLLSILGCLYMQVHKFKIFIFTERWGFCQKQSNSSPKLNHYTNTLKSQSDVD